LATEFIDDYMRRKYAAAESGWRTLPRVAKESNLSSSAVYGKRGGVAPDIGELIRRGLVETRVSLQERGRGGKVTRIRIAYDRDAVKDFVQIRIRNPADKASTQRVIFPRYRIAVLPFKSTSPDSSDEYLADGLTEELIGKLGRIKGFDLIARTSVMTFKNQEKTAEQVGRELWAGTLVEGSVRKAGGRVRVSVELIDANTAVHLWSGSYERGLDDLFEIQTLIAEQVAQTLQVRITPSEQKGLRGRATESGEAHALYLMGHETWLRGTGDSYRQALSFFERALQLDPSFAVAYAGLADCYSMLGDKGSIPQGEAIARAESYVRQATELGKGVAEVHLASAAIRYHNYDWKGAEVELRRAIALNKSYAVAYAWLGSVLRNTGRLDEALKEYRRAYELDPTSATMSNYLAIGYNYLHRTEEAIEQLKRTQELDAENPSAHALLGFVYLQRSMFRESLDEMEKFVASSAPGDVHALADLGVAYAISGRRGEAVRILSELAKTAEERDVELDSIGVMHLLLGEIDAGLKLLGRAIDERCSRWVPIMKVSSVFDPFRSDGRFTELVHRARLA
jgi:TolB-like protein/Flp pilus assembly protein TadD